MLRSSIEDKLLVLIDVISIGKGSDKDSVKILATTQPVLFNCVQVYDFRDFYMFTTSSSALGKALRDIARKAEELSQRGEEATSIASAMLIWDSTYFFEIYDKRIGVDLMCLFISKEEAREAGICELTYLAINDSNAEQYNDTIPAFLDNLQKGMNLLVVGAVIVDNVEDKNGGFNTLISLRPTTVIDSGSE